jgi:ABC-type sugar transport system ATPase subunit/ribose/xylose/arabinose/galactoside ABC-type transport system permease subunit
LLAAGVRPAACNVRIGADAMNTSTASVEPLMPDTAGQPTLSMQGITKHYDAIAALTDVSFDVLSGEVHALLGENGAGKSTLMNVASGATPPDAGVIVFAGETVENLTPAVAQELGIAMVHQHPALLPDMTVAENIRVAVPVEHLRRRDPNVTRAMRKILDDVHFLGHLEDRVSSLSVARRHLLELAKAFAISPRLLILDEPTAPLSQDSVELLFAGVRRVAENGTAVVYITHRLAEVREVAERVTVLRDGKLRATVAVPDISDAELLALIIGRTLEASFPPKPEANTNGRRPLLSVNGLSGHGFENVSLVAHPGEIVGIAGIVGNGQTAFLRSLAGRTASSGAVEVGGKELSRRKLLANAAYMPADRLTEGLMRDLNVRENTAMTALDRLRVGPFVSRRQEVVAVERELAELAVRAPSLEAPVSALSGGNQQKVVMSRSMLSEPSLLVADEPTQGVDVGARAEIYRILREVAAEGVPVVISSSDAKELEGLCDRVVVMSRGHAVATFEGDAVTEERIVHAAISATTHTADRSRQRQRLARAARFIEGDYAPVAVLALVMLVLGAYVYQHNHRYVSDFNINSVMFACAALGFISLGQTFALLLGGIDLSVGPLAGFLVVLASFFVLDGKSPAVWVLGFVLIFAAAVGVGLLNGSLIRFAKFTPVAATLVTYIGLGGLAFTLRSAPDGYIATSVTNAIATKVGPVPIAFVVFVLSAVGLELALRKAKLGHRMRAVGSDEESARRVGVPVNRTALLGYLGASILTLLGAVVLLAQLGVGDPGQGTGYTLTSITAVVLGGTSLLGGRGTFIGTLMGAGLSVQVLNATVFLGLDQKWQYIFQGLLIVAAAIIYSQVRRGALRAHGQAERT